MAGEGAELRKAVPLVPAQAGTWFFPLDSRFRGNERSLEIRVRDREN
jgi:hypothetical protein